MPKQVEEISNYDQLTERLKFIYDSRIEIRVTNIVLIFVVMCLIGFVIWGILLKNVEFPGNINFIKSSLGLTSSSLMNWMFKEIKKDQLLNNKRQVLESIKASNFNFINDENLNQIEDEKIKNLLFDMLKNELT